MAREGDNFSFGFTTLNSVKPAPYNTDLFPLCFQQPPFIDRLVTKTGEIVYTGFCIDLLNRLQQDMKFQYTIEVVPKNIYGSWDIFSQKWNGLIRYLVERVSIFLTLFVMMLFDVSIA